MSLSNTLSDIKPVVVASHPRSGTHLLIDLLRRQFSECNSWKWPLERLDRLYLNLDELKGTEHLVDEETALHILTRTERPIVKTHAFPDFEIGFLETHEGDIASDWVEWVKNMGTILYMYRDGRDVVCSYQLFRSSFDPDARCDIGTFLRQEDHGLNRVSRWAQHVRQWIRQPNVHPIKFEDVIKDTEDTLKNMENLLGLSAKMKKPLLPRPFHSIWESRAARLFGIRPESTAIINGNNKDWQSVFTPEDESFFEEHAGDLMSKIGYLQ